VYADIVIKKDTIRVYNVHLQSLKVSSDFAELQQEDSKRLVGRMGGAFKKQVTQVNAFLKHEESTPFSVIVAGFLPLRIDFVLTDPKFKITHFDNYSLSLSDHEPVKASFKIAE